MDAQENSDVRPAIRLTVFNFGTEHQFCAEAEADGYTDSIEAARAINSLVLAIQKENPATQPTGRKD